MSIPWDSKPRSLRGARLATTTILRPSSVFGGVGFGDAGENLAGRLLADVHGQLQQLGRAFDALGGLDLADLELHFGEVVNGDGVGRGRSFPAPPNRGRGGHSFGHLGRGFLLGFC